VSGLGVIVENCCHVSKVLESIPEERRKQCVRHSNLIINRIPKPLGGILKRGLSNDFFDGKKPTSTLAPTKLKLRNCSKKESTAKNFFLKNIPHLACVTQFVNVSSAFVCVHVCVCVCVFVCGCGWVGLWVGGFEGGRVCEWACVSQQETHKKVHAVVF